MSNTQDLHALLDQTTWMHALARRLVADPHLAADLAQETAVDALEHRPDTQRPLRGWLATVMRNNLAKLRRGDQNRSAREQAGRGGELEPSAHDVVEKAETHRNVVLAVLALAEPYRSTLLMRYFEQRSYDEIAQRTGVTRAAVNSRVTRALNELRLALENTYGGDRRALCIALIPLAKLPTGVATTILGVKTMHIALGTAAATLLAVTASVGFSVKQREARAPAPPPAQEQGGVAAAEELRPPLFFDHGPREASLPLLAEKAQRDTQKEKKTDDKNVWRTELFQALPLAATVKSLAVNSGAGDVEVLASRTNQLEIQAKVRAKLGTVEETELTQVFADHVEVSEEDGVLLIEDKHNNSRGWSVSFVVYVPGKLPLSANSGSGDVVVRRAQGTVTANTGSGDVRIDLPLERVQTLSANTGSGNVVVEVASIEGTLDANTGSGDVTMRVVDASSPGKGKLSSGSGDIHLIVPANVVASFDLETNGDDIELPRALGIQVHKSLGGQAKARGSIGNGGGSYELNSGSGGLKVEFGNSLPAQEK